MGVTSVENGPLYGCRWHSMYMDTMYTRRYVRLQFATLLYAWHWAGEILWQKHRNCWKVCGSYWTNATKSVMVEPFYQTRGKNVCCTMVHCTCGFVQPRKLSNHENFHFYHSRWKEKFRERTTQEEKTRRTGKKCYWDSKKKMCESLNSVVTKMSASLQCTRSSLTTSQSKIVGLKALILSASLYWDMVRMGKKKVLSLLCNNIVFIFFIQHTTKQIEFQWLNMLHEIKVWGLYVELLMWTKWWWMLR